MYIARDKDGTLSIYGHKPYKCENIWNNDTGDYSDIYCDVDLCPEVKWEDEEPTELILKK